MEKMNMFEKEEIEFLKEIFKCPKCSEEMTLQETLVAYLKRCIILIEQGDLKSLKSLIEYIRNLLHPY